MSAESDTLGIVEKKSVKRMTPEEIEEHNKRVNEQFDKTEKEFEISKIDEKIEDDKLLKDLMGDVEGYYQKIKLSPSVTIRVKLSISPELEKELVSLKESPDNEELREKMYRILANLCLDDPFNKTAGWRELDTIGAVPEIFGVIVERVMNYTERIRKFRENASRTAIGSDVEDKPATAH